MSKQAKPIILAAFLLFSLITITNPSPTHAAAATLPIGIVNYQLLVNQHPDTAQANAEYQTAVKQAQDDFNAKSANLSDADKKALFQQTQQGLQQKQQELLNAIRAKVNAAVKEIADAKGLAFVADKSLAIYGGQDITDDVLKKITGK